MRWIAVRLTQPIARISFSLRTKGTRPRSNAYVGLNRPRFNNFAVFRHRTDLIEWERSITAYLGSVRTGNDPKVGKREYGIA